MKYFIFIATLIVSISVKAGSTNTQKIERIQFNAESGDLFFIGEGKWTVNGCNDATYARFDPALKGLQEALSIGLAAYLSGKKVTFWGQCGSDNDYFQASYIIIRES